ncbi:MAG: hypothetical protein LKF36_06925 [Lactobacillus sp.]|jgi:hypothetical protein|nr:hypothetical protein [Lactobacillus sp.]
MKKYWGLLAVSLVLSLTACGNKNDSSSTTASSKSTVSSAIKTVAYSDLSKKQQASIFFQFKALQDIASGDGNHNTPAPFMVDMTVKNNSKQSVTFDQSKFLMFDENGDAPTVKSSKSGMMTLKPGAQQKIHSIFTNVQSQTLVGRGAFYYINTDFKLAYYLNANKGVDSNNLKSGEAKDLNDTPAHPQQSAASSSETDQTETQDNTTETQTNTSVATNQTDNNHELHVVNNPDEAMARLKRSFEQNGGNSSLINELKVVQYIPSTGNYVIDYADGPLGKPWYVRDDGMVKYPGDPGFISVN